jgi:hypothetical protein
MEDLFLRIYSFFVTIGFVRTHKYNIDIVDAFEFVDIQKKRGNKIKSIFLENGKMVFECFR